MSVTPQQLDEALTVLTGLVRAVPGVSDELAASRSDFVGRSAPVPGSPDERLAQRRHLEWFLLERPSNGMGGVPVEAALHSSDGEDLRDDLGEDVLAALVGSRCGIFTVTGVRRGEGVWLRDLIAFGEYPLQEADGSHALEEGDLIVGRLFPIGAELHRISPAAGTWRNAALVTALTADLEAARANLRGVPRLGQEEIERMFWGEERARNQAVLERARSVLLAAGLGAGDVQDIFDHLRRAPVDSGHPTPGGGDALGVVLDQLAIDTEIDIDEARAALLEAWPLLRAPRNPGSPVEEVDVAQAIASFDEGRTAGRDIEELFDELEAELQLSPDEDEDQDLAPDFPGVVGAMVEEFLWEVAAEHGAEVATGHERLRQLSRFAATIGVFEELGTRQLLTFAAVWLPEQGVLGSGDDAVEMLASLRAFCQWSEAQHEHPLAAAFDADLAPLEESLPRVVEANRSSTPADPGEGELFEYIDGSDDRATLRDLRGTQHSLGVPSIVTAHLRAGDRVRGRRDADERLTIYCCYPAECAVLGPQP